MKEIKVSFLYSRSSQRQVDSLKAKLWSLQDFVNKAREARDKKYSYLQQLDWLRIEDEKFKQSLDFMDETQVWVLFITSELINPFPNERSDLFGLEILRKIKKEYDKKVRIILPITDVPQVDFKL